MRDYVAFYRGRKLEFKAESMLAAQTHAAKEFGARKNWEVAVVLADVPVATAGLP